MKNPYLDENGYDHIAYQQHCAHCEDILTVNGEVVKDHVVGVWIHYATLDFPGVRALDEQGRTKEQEWAQPPRRVRVRVPMQTGLHFCKECFPFDEIVHIGCNGCDDDLSPEEDDLTHAEFLWKRTDGYNGPLLKGKFHLRCLPEHFGLIHDYRKAKLR